MLFMIDLSKEQPIIGICLGMQLLFDSSNEIKKTKGLGIIPGKILAFEQKVCMLGGMS